MNRLKYLRLDPWGPDGVRYVCFLFWDFRGYRHLTNQIDRETWERWHLSSGQFWDLFLAGCYSYGPPNCYGDRALPLTSEGQFGAPPILWSERQTKVLARELSAEARQAGAPAWSPSAPLELVTVGARRDGQDVAFDWASLRSAAISANALGAAVSDYTESHIGMDPEIIPDDLPVPGDFEDNLPREIWRDLLKHVGLLRFLFHRLS
ncbi:hypothetical protein [Streptomyces massasporeus]|uniref:hypothetical protein n=1 Tax=Streptomyces massasporeus TaxID=67324 RepID=UPI0033F1E781